MNWKMQCIGADPLYLENQSSTMYPPLKRTAVEASAPVVGILGHLGEVEIFRCSGFVVECDSRHGRFISSILTSASILRPHPDIDEVRNDLEISVTLSNDVTCKGIVSESNLHYNIAIIEIATDVPMETSRLKLIDDSITVDPNYLDENPPENDNQSDKYNLVPGTTVVALWRYHDKGNKLMVVAGEFSLAVIRLDCRELFRASFRISKVRSKDI